MLITHRKRKAKGAKLASGVALRSAGKAEKAATASEPPSYSDLPYRDAKARFSPDGLPKLSDPSMEGLAGSFSTPLGRAFDHAAREARGRAGDPSAAGGGKGYSGVRGHSEVAGGGQTWPQQRHGGVHALPNHWHQRQEGGGGEGEGERGGAYARHGDFGRRDRGGGEAGGGASGGGRD